MNSPLRTALVRREIANGCAPLDACQRLRGRGLPWLLESSSGTGGFSFAGADPWLLLSVRGGEILAECRRRVTPALGPGRFSACGDVFQLVRRWLPRLPDAAAPAELPFVGGALAVLGYELADGFEKLAPAGRDDLALPDASFLFVDHLLAWDHASGRLAALGLGFGTGDAEARARADEAARAAQRWLETPAATAGRGPVQARPRPAPPAAFDAGSYAEAVELVKQEIAAGNVYQACLTHRMERRFPGDAFELYRALRGLNPAPFACYLELPDATVVGSSPERFLRVGSDGRVESRPIKGTRPRGRSPAADAAQRAALVASAKDRAENLMIVDLVRNDLGRVCETGSIEVPELMAIEEYAAVFQLVSTVSGRLRQGCDALDAVRAAFPPGSMTGAPKIAAMNLLRRIEPVRRGFYSGAIGYLDARGGADLSVVIRTVLVREGLAYVHSGGGIVADSDPADEWRETLHKARPLLAALQQVGAEGALQAVCPPSMESAAPFTKRASSEAR